MDRRSFLRTGVLAALVDPTAPRAGDPRDAMPPDIADWYHAKDAPALGGEDRLVATARGIWSVFVHLRREHGRTGPGILEVSHWDGEAFDEVGAPDFHDITIPISSTWVYVDIVTDLPYRGGMTEPRGVAFERTASQLTTMDFTLVLSTRARLTVQLWTRGQTTWTTLALEPDLAGSPA